MQDPELISSFILKGCAQTCLILLSSHKFYRNSQIEIKTRYANWKCRARENMPSSTKISELQVNNFKKVPFVYIFILFSRAAQQQWDTTAKCKWEQQFLQRSKEPKGPRTLRLCMSENLCKNYYCHLDFAVVTFLTKIGAIKQTKNLSKHNCQKNLDSKNYYCPKKLDGKNHYHPSF